MTEAEKNSCLLGLYELFYLTDINSTSIVQNGAELRRIIDDFTKSKQPDPDTVKQLELEDDVRDVLM